MDFVLTGLMGIDCSAYLDDLICHSATMEGHAEKLDRILRRLERTDFKIQPSKCVFAPGTVEYLGHIRDQGGS
jgi:putative component of membrane protein insertase Oxa1/YidC/SpoIIIJ protein YidD